MSKRILLVDPSRTIQTLLSAYFMNAHHSVIICSTMQDALTTLVSLHQVPDMIFLALDQKNEAYKVITYLKEHEAYVMTRLVGMGSQQEQIELQRTFGESRTSYLVKPFRIQEAMALVSAPALEAVAFSRISQNKAGLSNFL